ncbi:unnamed protein product [Lupinus luteus]|uniref:Uncharacterized protein n=1 Tax=Lupinus luteus TaxID=3873 RepID=A0AAV1Y7N8_LUPLU
MTKILSVGAELIGARDFLKRVQGSEVKVTLGEKHWHSIKAAQSESQAGGKRWGRNDSQKKGRVKRADPKGKKIALGGRSKNSELNVLSDGKPKTPRTFTPLGITLSRTLERLQKHGVLTPLPPSPSPDPLPPRYKAHAYCKYH